MKKWLQKIIIGDGFHHLANDISMLDHEVRKVRKEIVDLRNEILFALLENRSLLKLIVEERKIVNDIKNNVEVVKVEDEPVIKREIPYIPDKEVTVVKSILTQEDVKEIFEYRDGDLYWKIDVSKRSKAGTKAGTIDFQKRKNISYKVIVYQQKKYTIPRLIFLMFNGYLPEFVTYKDGDSLNTRIENLIEANRSEVGCRRKVPSNSKSGIKGVSFDKRVNKWVAMIMKNGKYMYLGLFNTKEEAEKAYLEAWHKLYGNFNNKCSS